jgi:hypothetical protein
MIPFSRTKATLNSRIATGQKPDIVASKPAAQSIPPDTTSKFFSAHTFIAQSDNICFFFVDCLKCSEMEDVGYSPKIVVTGHAHV